MTEAPTLEIRAYRELDEAAVVALWRACELLRPWNDPGADIALCRKTPASELFVASAGGGDGDALWATIMCGSDGHRGWLYYLAVDPSRRRVGVASSMVQHAEQWLEERGIRKVELMIRPENDTVRSFYEYVGYAVEPRVVMSRWLGDSGD